jgi:A/G-specific adenine glycosylase
VFQLSRYDVETDIALLLPGVCSFGFRIDAKRQSCYQSGDYGVWLQCVPKVQVVFACLTIVVVLPAKKKVDQLPVKSKLKVRNRYFNYLVVSDENENTLIQREPLKEFGKIYMSFL